MVNETRSFQYPFLLPSYGKNTQAEIIFNAHLCNHPSSWFRFSLESLRATPGAYLSSRAPGCPAVPRHRGLSTSDADGDTLLAASFRTRTFALVPRKETPELLKTARPLLWPYINFSFAPAVPQEVAQGLDLPFVRGPLPPASAQRGRGCTFAYSLAASISAMSD